VDRPRADLRYKPRQSQLGAAEEVQLQPGDVFYMPRGFVHEASTTGALVGDDGPSLHLTFGLEASVETTWEAALHALVDCGGAPPTPSGDWAAAAEVRRLLAPWTTEDVLHAATSAAAGRVRGALGPRLRSAAILVGDMAAEAEEAQAQAQAELAALAGEVAAMEPTEVIDYLCSLREATMTIDEEFLTPTEAGGRRRRERQYLYDYLSHGREAPFPPLCEADRHELRTSQNSAAVRQLLSSWEHHAREEPALLEDAVNTYKYRLRMQMLKRERGGQEHLRVLLAS